jgi:hypothetical protein
VFGARERRKASESDVISVPSARAAFETIDPQMVIESILSREWCNTDPNARWRKGKRDLLKGFNALPGGGTTKTFTEAELYRQINNLYASRPGAVAARIPPEDLGFLLQVFKGLNEYFADSSIAAPQLINNVGAGPARAASEQSVIAQNLLGDGPAQRWRAQVTAIIRNQSIFTGLRLVLEQSVDALSPVAILGLEGVDEAYKTLNQTLPADQQLPIPDAKEVVLDGNSLIRAVDGIQTMQVVGQPSANNSLDMEGFANHQRLHELLRTVLQEISDATIRLTRSWKLHWLT